MPPRAAPYLPQGVCGGSSARRGRGRAGPPGGDAGGQTRPCPPGNPDAPCVSRPGNGRPRGLHGRDWAGRPPAPARGAAGAAGGADPQLREDSASDPRAPVPARLLTGRLWRPEATAGLPGHRPQGPRRRGAREGERKCPRHGRSQATRAPPSVPGPRPSLSSPQLSLCPAHGPLAAAGSPGEGNSSSHCGGLGPALRSLGLRCGRDLSESRCPWAVGTQHGHPTAYVRSQRGAEAAATTRPTCAVSGPSRRRSTTEQVAVPGLKAQRDVTPSHQRGPGAEGHPPWVTIPQPAPTHVPRGPRGRWASRGTPSPTPALSLSFSLSPRRGQSGRTSRSRGLVQEEGPARAKPREEAGRSPRDTRVQAPLTHGHQGAAEDSPREATGCACGLAASATHGEVGSGSRGLSLQLPAWRHEHWSWRPRGPPGPPQGGSRRHRGAVGTGRLARPTGKLRLERQGQPGEQLPPTGPSPRPLSGCWPSASRSTHLCAFG